MNPSKFSLADLLTVLGTVVFGFICFLSFNFLTLGKTIPSIIWSAILALILGGFAYGAKLLKKTSRNFTTCIIWEWLFLFLFIVIAIFSIIPFSHFFVVSLKKDEIQQKQIANISQAEGMFSQYEDYTNTRQDFYNSNLKSVVSAKKIRPHDYYDHFGFVDGTDDKTQVENKLFILKAQLYPSNYQEMKLRDSTWLANSKKTIEGWKPINLINVINRIESNVTSSKNELIQFSTFRAPGEPSETTKDFDYKLTFENTSNEFITMGSPTPLSIIYAIGLFILMLLSYFITKRHTRYPGLKVIFSTGDIEENEL